MDFSSISRALESLQRRQPPLPNTVLDACDILTAFLSENWIEEYPSPLLESIQTLFLEEARWEALAVGLYVGTEILRPISVDDEKTSPSCRERAKFRAYFGPTAWMMLVEPLHNAARKHFEHPEPRIRTLIIQAVGVYIKAKGIAEESMELLAEELFDPLWSRIQQELPVVESIQVRVENETCVTAGGYVFLETVWLVLASLIGALSYRYAECLPPKMAQQELLGAIEATMMHSNPHVRIAALQTMEQMLRAKAAIREQDDRCFFDPGFPLRSPIVPVVASGLSDQSSQVRLAASALCRTWFDSLPCAPDQYISNQPLDEMMSLILPRLCFNRFDSALGVKLRSQETWKWLFCAVEEDEAPPVGRRLYSALRRIHALQRIREAVGGEEEVEGGDIEEEEKEREASSPGLRMVVELLPAMCGFYAQKCHSDQLPNIRSSAGAAICELIVRIGHHPDYRSCLKPYLFSLWQALMTNAQDSAWPVREAAGVALGAFCKAFPEIVKEERNNLWDLWTEQLTDPVGSEAAAVGLADLWEAFGLDDDRIRGLINQQLPRRNESLEDTCSFTDHPFDAPEIRSNIQRHGCPHCGKKASDGCIYLIREYVVRGTVEGIVKPLLDRELVPLLESLVDACRVQPSVELRATLWKCLPSMAVALGKQRFKKIYLDLFTDLLCSNLEPHSASHVSHAASQCAEELAALVGPTIFRGRLEKEDQECFDRVMRERRFICLDQW